MYQSVNPIIDKYVWIACILGIIVQVNSVRTISKTYITQNPSLQDGYNKIFKSILFYGNIPWVIMGMGNLLGLTNGVLDYLHQKEMNPIVLIFHSSIIILGIFHVKWIYFNKGAEFLEQHPGFITKKIGFKGSSMTSKEIKFFLLFGLFFQISLLLMVWFVFPSRG